MRLKLYFEKENLYNFDNIDFEEISVNPDENEYFYLETYNMPKVII